MAGAEASPGAHFASTHTRQSTLTRASADTYRGNSTTGYKKGDWQAHHILCEHALGSRSFKAPDKEFAEQCLWVTKWDLNDAHNMIGMPIRSDFRREDGKMGMDICSHANDHNTPAGYTDECKDHLQTNIWDKIKKSQNGHTTKPSDISATLKAATTSFRTKLSTRAAREGGTLHMWKERHKPANANKWYKPFSMAKNGAVVPRLPGAKTSVASAMGDIFKRIR